MVDQPTHHLIIDGYNLMHRARSGFKEGDYSIVYNFFRSLKPLIEHFEPEDVYFVLEGSTSWRTVIDPGYKANRVLEPDDPKKIEHDRFVVQKRIIVDILRECLPIKVVKHPGFEGDDVIASLCTWLSAAGAPQITVVSGDSDFIQLLNRHENVRVFHPISKLFRPKPPYDYVMWKSLRGDLTDNVPGLEGIGDKRAEQLLASPDLLAKIMEDPTTKAQFEKNISLIRFIDIPHHHFVDGTAKGMMGAQPNWEKLRARFTEMGFKSIVDNPKYWDKFTAAFSDLKP